MTKLNLTNRYNQQIGLPNFGTQMQQQLLKSKILVIGAGGIGCPLLIYLCSMGIGHITIVDGDTVEESNLNRQILFDINDIGKPKALIAMNKLRQLNPNIKIDVINNFLNYQNATEVCKGYDIIVEGTDNLEVRIICDEISKKFSIPYVYGSIFQLQGQVAVFNYKGSLSYLDIFRILDYENNYVPTCANNGTLPALTGIVGTLMAGECIKLITQIGEPLINGLFLIDIKTNRYEWFSIDKGNVDRFKTSKANFVANSFICKEKLLEWLLNNKPVQLVDVREQYERKIYHLGGIHYPYSEFSLENITSFLNYEVPIVFYCEHGIRSAKIVQILLSKGINNVYSLIGGSSLFCEFRNIYPKLFFSE